MEVPRRGGQKADRILVSGKVVLNQKELDSVLKGLQNLYASVRFRPAPPALRFI